MLRAAGACVTGPAHQGAGEAGQDALSLKGWRSGWIAAVADGLGSRPLSARGSRLAVQTAQACLREQAMPASVNPDARSLATVLYRRWLSQRPGHDLPTQAATTLLLAACDSSGKVQTWQIGDGLILAYTDGQVRVLTPERSGFGNETRALGVDRGWTAWNTAQFSLSQPGDLVALMTDGVADDLPATALPGFLRTLHRELQRRSRRQGRRWLTHEMLNWATPGHSDDKTLAVIYKK